MSETISLSPLDTTTQSQAREQWPFIVATCRRLGSLDYYVTDEIARAVHRAAPRSATSVGSWDDRFAVRTLADYRDRENLEALIRIAGEMFPASLIVAEARRRYGLA